jgi:tetratricopeptide (TPR) repeat protein
MQLQGVILRVILYYVIAALIVFGLHIYLTKRADDKRRAVSPPAATVQAEADSAPAAEQNLPAVEPPKPEFADIIKTGENPSELAQKAKESLLRKDYKSAVELCGRLAEKDGKAFLCAGMAQFMLGDYAQAAPSLEKALIAGADEYQCRKYLAFSYYYMHDLDKGISSAEKALSIKKEAELETFYARLMREKKAHRNFISESSGHFKIEYDGYEHGSMSRTVIAMLEDAYSTIGRDLDYYPTGPITVILYTRHDFQDVTQMPGWIAGFFDKRDGKIRVPVKGAEGKEAMLRTVLFHEYVHALIYSITRNCPLWVHEGLAEYYSKGPSQRVGQIIPLNRLESSFAGLDGRGIIIAYIESHSAVSHLMERYGAHRVKGLLVSLAKGNDTNRAFTDSFHLSYTEFIDKWGKR